MKLSLLKTSFEIGPLLQNHAPPILNSKLAVSNKESWMDIIHQLKTTIKELFLMNYELLIIDIIAQKSKQKLLPKVKL